MNFTRRDNGPINASAQIPRSPTVPQARRSTFVDSPTTRPAPPAANFPAFIRCQSVGNPFTAEYWCIGGTTMRLRSSASRMASGENSSIPDIYHFLVRPRASKSRHRGSRRIGLKDIRRHRAGKAGILRVSCPFCNPPSLVELRRTVASCNDDEHALTHQRSSYPAKAGYPVRCGLSIPSLTSRNIGSPAFAGVRDDRDTPLEWDETVRVLEVIWVKREAEYFCK